MVFVIFILHSKIYRTFNNENQFIKCLSLFNNASTLLIKLIFHMMMHFIVKVNTWSVFFLASAPIEIIFKWGFIQIFYLFKQHNLKELPWIFILRYTILVHFILHLWKLLYHILKPLRTYFSHSTIIRTPYSSGPCAIIQQCNFTKVLSFV